MEKLFKVKVVKNFFDLQLFATIEGTAGNDELSPETVDTIIYGYEGHDTIYNNSFKFLAELVTTIF